MQTRLPDGSLWILVHSNILKVVLRSDSLMRNGLENSSWLVERCPCLNDARAGYQEVVDDWETNKILFCFI